MARSIEDVLNRLLNAPAESEILEFEDNRRNLSDDEFGEYFSALSNEANLNEVESAWLVFGVNDRTRNITGTEYKNTADGLNHLKLHISNNVTDNLSFRSYEIHVDGRRVLLFEIPPAEPGVPTRYRMIAYGREGESKTVLSPEKYERIVRQTRPDWSAAIVRNATVDDLDPQAVALARVNFIKKNPRLEAESKT